MKLLWGRLITCGGLATRLLRFVHGPRQADYQSAAAYQAALHDRRGNMVLEVAMWLPILFLLIGGMIQVGKWTYLDYSLNKILYSAARQVAVQQGLNFCDPADPATQGALTAAINDPVTGLPLISTLTVDMLQLTTQCLDATGALGACDVSGCGGIASAQRPDFITVSMPNGYTIQPRIPYILLNPFVLRPTVTVPFDGSSL